MKDECIKFKDIKIGSNFYDKKLYRNWEGDSYCKRYYYKKTSETKALFFNIEKEIEMSQEEYFFISSNNNTKTTNEFVGDYW